MFSRPAVPPTLRVIDAARGEIDIHGYHPHDRELWPIVDQALADAKARGLREVRVIHGHGFNRESAFYISRFTSSNTGMMGQAVRSYLRKGGPFHTTKLDCVHEGSTVAYIRVRPVRTTAAR